MNAREKISKAIVTLLNNRTGLPFYAEMLLRTKIMEFPERVKQSPHFSPTMAVDLSGNIMYDEGFVHGLSERELLFVLLHEVTHKVYMHVQRGNDLKANALAWNVAADIVVDFEIKHSQASHVGAEPLKDRLIADSGGNITLKTPHGNLKIKDVGNKSVEQVYSEIKNFFPEEENLSDALGTKIDDHIQEDEDGNPGSGMGENELREITEKILDDVAQSAAAAKKKGSLPKGLERMLEKLLRGKVDWRAYLYRWLTNTLPRDYTWSKPNRRHLWQKLILPSRKNKGLNIAVTVDTSGSISSTELAEFIAEINSIMAMHRNIRMTVVVHDDDVHKTHEISSDNPCDAATLELGGYGGTSHVPAFEWLKDNKPDIRHVICFTDGYTSFPNEELRRGKDVLWLLTSNACDNDSIPFGSVVRLPERG